MAVLTCPQSSFYELFRRSAWGQAALFVEEGPHDIETSDPDGPFEIELRAAFGDELRPFAAAVGQTGIDDTAVRVVRRHRMGERCAGPDENVDQLRLHAAPHRVDARRDETQRRRPAIHLADRIDVGTCGDQPLGDADGILRRLLPEVFDAICSDIEQKRRMVRAPGPRVDQFGTGAEEPIERGLVAIHNGVGGRLELSRQRGLVPSLHRERLELGPGVELVIARDDRPGVAAGNV